MQTDTVIDTILDLARDKGAEYPTIADSTEEDAVIILDTASGRTWRVVLKEF